MSFTVKKHPELPCLIVTVLPGFRLKRDMPGSDPGAPGIVGCH